jgi:hypothetical protein
MGQRNSWFSVLLVRFGVFVLPVQCGLRRGGVALPCTRAGPQKFKTVSMIVPATAAILKSRTAYQFFCAGRGEGMVLLSTLSGTGYAARMCMYPTCSINRSSSRSSSVRMAWDQMTRPLGRGSRNRVCRLRNRRRWGGGAVVEGRVLSNGMAQRIGIGLIIGGAGQIIGWGRDTGV